MIYENVLDMVGNTPILKLANLREDDMAELYIKLEKYNPGGSVKDRAALSMIEEAESQGLLNKNSVIVEPTSGNTGIALCLIGKLKGYKVIIVMPDTMSVERRNLVKFYGGELILTPGKEGMKGAIKKAEELLSLNPSYFMPNQFDNMANVSAHYNTTALEIIKDIPDIDAVVSGVGTGGSITGIGKKLKELNKDIIINAVEPTDSPFLSTGTSGSHKIQGIGAGFKPSIYDETVVDFITTVKNEEAFDTVALLGEKEGLFLGISSGASVHAGISLAKKLGPNKKVLIIAPDGGEKYLSLDFFLKGDE